MPPAIYSDVDLGNIPLQRETAIASLQLLACRSAPSGTVEECPSGYPEQDRSAKVAEKEALKCPVAASGFEITDISNTKKANTNLSILIDNSGMIEANSFRLTRRLCGEALSILQLVSQAHYQLFEFSTSME